MKTLTLILGLLKRLLDFLKNKKVRDESEKLKENPTDWYNEHFDSADRVLPDDKRANADEASDNSNSKG